MPKAGDRVEYNGESRTSGGQPQLYHRTFGLGLVSLYTGFLGLGIS